LGDKPLSTSVYLFPWSRPFEPCSWLVVRAKELTVYENVYFSARLRLPPDTDLKDTAARVETALKDVGISHVKDTLVGA